MTGIFSLATRRRGALFETRFVVRGVEYSCLTARDPRCDPMASVEVNSSKARIEASDSTRRRR